MKPLDAQATPLEPPGGALAFILFTAFLNLLGIGIVGPVLPYLAARYVSPEHLATATALLFSSFAFTQFLAVPGMGALSDRYGRRPILLTSLVGSGIGYLLFGIGGALWVLFLGRIIDGITGGNLSAIYAYGADITTPQDRTKYFGLIGAASSLGFVVGPAIGGILSVFGYAAPMFFAAAVTFGNALFGYFILPESLPEARRALNIRLSQINPLSQFRHALTLPQLRWLLLSTFLWTFAFAALPANLTVLTKDRLGWEPGHAGLLFTIFGIVGMLIQGGMLRRWVPRFGEIRLAIAGLAIMGAGYMLLAAVAYTAWEPLTFIAAVVTAIGNGLSLPTLTALFSQVVGPREQGRVQGGNQSMQALGRVVGPLWAGLTYSVSSGMPYLSGAVFLGFAALGVILAIPIITATRQLREESAAQQAAAHD